MNYSLSVFTLPGKVRRQRETSFFPPLSVSLPPYVDLRCEFKIDGGVAAVAVVESIPTFKASNEHIYTYLGGLLPLVSRAPSDRRVTHRGP